MNAFRRLTQQAKKTSPRIESTTIAELSTIAALPVSIRSTIGSDELLLCVANIETSTRQYTLLLDLEWVSMAVELNEQQGDMIAGLPLPRAAVRAVINGWVIDQPFDQPAPRWSADDIPHVGFPLTDDPEIS